MNINDVFPSKYLKAADLQGRQVTVTIDRAEQEKIGEDQKMILYFQGKEKGLVCNKTNANNIAALYGPDTDDWRGAEIVLFEAAVDFQGKTVQAIRVRGAPRKPQHRKPESGPQHDAADLNDPIPF